MLELARSSDLRNNHENADLLASISGGSRLKLVLRMILLLRGDTPVNSPGGGSGGGGGNYPGDGSYPGEGLPPK